MRVLSFVIVLLSLFFLKQVTQSPHGPKFKISCKTCHSAKGWELDRSVYSFDHNTTKMPLFGQHASIDCKQCHKSLVFSEARTACIDCHKDIHQSTVGPDCSRCHNQFSWLVNNINDIHRTSRFPLMGAHRTADCAQCHVSESLLRFDVPGVNCIDCHRANYMATTNPNHMQSGISQDCQQCHSMNAFQWENATFDHSIFPLTQGHSTVKCTDCHKDKNYASTPTDCYSCHQQNYIAAKNPDHVLSGFSTLCQNCHTLSPGWQPANFDHSAFPLTLGHANINCTDCHKGGNYTTTPTDCYSCHQQNYQSTTNPNHTTAGIPTTCQTCHTTNPGWQPATFNHGAFPLTLGHSTATCNDCHKGNYTSTSSDCNSCHQQNYLATTNPNHTTAGIPTTCQTCHTTNPGWTPATFNHGTFPLTLGHSSALCNDCHKGNYTSTSADCYSCHQQNYLSTTNPNHQTAGIPTTCQTCHTTNPGWTPATFNHGTFPLTLGHSTASCNDCHKGNYTSTSTDCYSCHQQNYLSTTNPNHQTAGIPTTCQTCHTTNPGWAPATFNHTTFPLTLGHATPTCNDCHKGNYTSTSTDCYSCHQTDYNNTTNPNHKTLGFSTACTQCHTTNPGWAPATYTAHDTQFFPIYSGRHLGQWTLCTDCHTTPTNYNLFDCIHCHTNAHTGKGYTNAQCYSCHPRGTSD